MPNKMAVDFIFQSKHVDRWFSVYVEGDYLGAEKGTPHRVQVTLVDVYCVDGEKGQPVPASLAEVGEMIRKEIYIKAIEKLFEQAAAEGFDPGSM